MKEIEDRRSIRKYKQTAIADENIEQILESGRLAPSGDNTQPWKFVIVKNEKTKELIAEASHKQKWMINAPVFIVCIADIRAQVNSSEEIFVDEETGMFELKQVIRDTSIAVEHMILEATRLGIGTCWIGWYKQSEIRKVLGVPSDKFVLGIITLGYADENPKQRSRKIIEEIVFYESWGSIRK